MVLIVEDDDDVRAYLVDVVRSLGYGVSAAASAKLALDLLRQQDKRVNLLLTDVVMPEMNGRQLATTKLRPDLKVLYMTGYSRNAETRLSNRIGSAYPRCA
jgi:CheY-like chemotaxis protein